MTRLRLRVCQLLQKILTKSWPSWFNPQENNIRAPIPGFNTIQNVVFAGFEPSTAQYARSQSIQTRKENNDSQENKSRIEPAAATVVRSRGRCLTDCATGLGPAVRLRQGGLSKSQVAFENEDQYLLIMEISRDSRGNTIGRFHPFLKILAHLQMRKPPAIRYAEEINNLRSGRMIIANFGVSIWPAEAPSNNHRATIYNIGV